MRPWFLLALLLSACAPMTTPQPPVTNPPAPQRVEVALKDFEFSPNTLQVAPGTTVVFKNLGQVPHTVTDSAGRFDSGNLSPGGEYSYTFQTPGSYSIYCRYHPYMTLNLRVGP